jgi:Protein of unknown function (DUF1706)
MSRAVGPLSKAKKEEEPNMPDQMTKASLLETLHSERSRWEALLTEVGEARMTTPILASWWSVKDIIAHVAWHERQTAAVLQPDPGRRLVRDWLWVSAESKRNAVLYTESRDRALPEVQADAHQAYAQLVAAVEALMAKDLADLHRFPNTPPGWQPWSFIAGHSYEHYREHMPSIRAWLDTLEPEADTTDERAVAARV